MDAERARDHARHGQADCCAGQRHVRGPSQVVVVFELGMFKANQAALATRPCCCSEGGIRYMSRVVMHNTECSRRFGAVRSQAEYSQELGKLTEEARTDRRKWLINIARVQKSVLCCHVLMHAPKHSFSKSSNSCMEYICIFMHSLDLSCSMLRRD